MSRREFLKILGGTGASMLLGGLALWGSSKENKPIIPAGSQAYGLSPGSWLQGQNTSTVAIHATLLPDASILYMAGSGYHRSHLQGPFESRLLSSSGSETNVPMQEDLWCSGHALLPNGNVLIAGGTQMYDTDPNNCSGQWHGLRSVTEFQRSTKSLTKTATMAAGRWYPSVVELADGRMCIVEGFDDYGSENRLVEIYDPATKSVSIKYDPGTSLKYCIGEGTQTSCPGANTVCFGGTSGNGVAPKIGTYPRFHMIPSGLLVTCGMHPIIRSFDPSTGKWLTLTNMSTYRHYGTSVLLPLNNTATEKGKILVAGGSPDSAALATNNAEIIDFNASSTNVPVVRTVMSLKYARKFADPVILPDGKVIIFGGSRQVVTNYVYYPEMFDPVAETWTTLPAATVPRSYHSVAVLMPDGTVWTAGTTPTSSVWELRTEIFRPWYYSETRPTISGAPTVGDYNTNITIPTPDAANITKVSLVRLMSTTHHYEPNMRLVWLQIKNRTSNSVVSSAPINSKLAPPGYYYVHVLNGAGVPSAAKIIKIPGSGTGTLGDTTAPSKVAGLAISPASSSQLNLSWTANTEPDINHYNVYRSTTSGFTPGTSNRITQVTANSFNNTGLTPATTYYYRVSAVDNSGNEGPVSDQSSGKTLPLLDITSPSVKITSPKNKATLPKGVIAVLGTAVDNLGGSGIKVVEVRVNFGSYTLANATSANWATWSASVSILSGGDNRITARATDKAGNQATASVGISIV